MEGLFIKAKEGRDVYAVASGKVVFSDLDQRVW